jgi:hypothetical protein
VEQKASSLAQIKTGGGCNPDSDAGDGSRSSRQRRRPEAANA